MLNLSDNPIRNFIRTERLSAYQLLEPGVIHRRFKRLLFAMTGMAIVFLFLPWTQNIRADGKVTTLSPEHRPQQVQATIAGRIEKWYVSEGQLVHKGDTIVFISEIKTDYFDPALIDRTGGQVIAKEQAMGAYGMKANALHEQVGAMRAELASKQDQIQNKIKQAILKNESDRIDFERAKIDQQIAQRQYDGTRNLYDKGLKSLTELEEKRLKLQETGVKLVEKENKYGISKNELANASIEQELVKNEYANKIAKAESERYSTLSDQFDAEATVNKMKITRDNYTRRASFYYITAPQDGYVVKALQSGIGETVKEGEAIISIQPQVRDMAVEMYVRPVDVPLIAPGRAVRFVFDGWPAFVFAGWPGQSLGTFGGRVVAIDRDISANGKFRVLVAADPHDKPWPDLLYMGGGAKGIALLDDVPLWYELWRQLNGFPPDFYKEKDSGDSAKKTAK
jgi:multidrug resistance efflux pump